MERVYREIARDTARATGALVAQLLARPRGSEGWEPLATEGPALSERFRREVLLAILADDPVPADAAPSLEGGRGVVRPAPGRLEPLLGLAPGAASVYLPLGDGPAAAVLHLLLPAPPARLPPLQAVARLAEGGLAARAARAELSRGQHRVTDLLQAREVLAGLQVAGTQLMIEADEEAILSTVSRELARLGLHSAVLLAEAGAPEAAPAFRWRLTSFSAAQQRAIERILGRPLAGLRLDPAGAPSVRRALEDGRGLAHDRPRAAAAELLGGATAAQLRALRRLLGTLRLVLAPLRWEGRTAGFLAVAAPRLRAGDPEAIEAFALQASVALEKARLVRALREERARLEGEVARRTRDLTRAVEALQETDRRKDNFLANVSHELRTPLVTVLGWAELLAGEKLGELAPRQRQAVQVIGASGRRLKGFIDELLDLSRHELTRDRLALAAFPVGELLAQAAVSLAPRFAERGVRLRLRAAPRLPDLWADRDRVLQVLVNLLANAERHSPPGTTVRLAAARGKAGALEVSVADQGSGIPAEHLARIFDRLYQVRDAARPRADGGGLGLGLAIARAIVEAHGGRIGVRSRPGRGTAFRFNLPTVERLDPP